MIDSQIFGLLFSYRNGIISIINSSLQTMNCIGGIVSVDVNVSVSNCTFNGANMEVSNANLEVEDSQLQIARQLL